MSVPLNRNDRSTWQTVAVMVSLLGLWGVANFSALAWLTSTLESAAPINLIFTIFACGFVGWGLLRKPSQAKRKPWIRAIPYLRWGPLSILISSGLASIALKSWENVPQLEVLLFALGSYGLLGLFLSPSTWKLGWPAAVLVSCLLPFSTQFQTGLGTPARVLTAHWVERAMHLWQISAISANDIIVLENGIAHVDLPCSGLKSLWTGSLFLLVVTGLERRQLGLKWLLAAFGTVFALFWANAFRVFLLVLMVYGLNAPQVAEMMHVPLGLIGFSLSCAACWYMLQWVPQAVEATENSVGQPDAGPSPLSSKDRPITRNWQFGLLASMAAFAIASHRIVPPVSPAAIAAIQLPQQLQATPLPLSDAEKSFFTHSNNPIAEKWRFDWGGLTGSMLMVVSQNWQVHHPPELCFAGNGFRVDGMRPEQLGQDLEARWLSLERGQLSATYWFQSPQGTTDEYMTRFWESITHRETPWMMVSILFDRSLEPDSEGVRSMTTAIRAAIEESFQPASLALSPVGRATQ